MSRDVFSKDEKYRNISFTKFEPIAINDVEACVIRFQLPLVITTKRLDHAVDMIDEKLAKIEKGVW